MGLRIRRAEVYEKHPDDFTVRLRRGCDNRTELDRIKGGTPDISFYFHGDAGTIVRWRMLDLSIFRLAAFHWFWGVRCDLIEHADYRFMAYSIPTFARYGTFCIAEG